MKKYLFPVFALISMLQIVACNSSASNTNEMANESESSSKAMEDGHKYQIKAAIVTSKITNTMMESDITTMLYFDDYGDKQITKTDTKMTMDGHTMETHICSMMKDGWSYSWEEGKTTGNKFQMKDAMDASKMDYSNITEDMKKQFGIEKIGTETVLGKKCDKYSMKKEGMGFGTFWIWNNIPMKSESTINEMSINIEVTNIDENPNFSNNEFDLPENITFIERTMPAKTK